ncbi:hypothetical protein NPIL_130591 [Nephila pilipes]|uniref:Uncharacterized protein n=1 Tax=Nephila pilipes TaxID=299642 RepID=A0A8X6PT74_NEPPI|nr:hypothetical protein NPIL_130591 [Nephila pilipes]
MDNQVSPMPRKHGCCCILLVQQKFMLNTLSLIHQLITQVEGELSKVSRYLAEQVGQNSSLSSCHDAFFSVFWCNLNSFQSVNSYYLTEI